MFLITSNVSGVEVPPENLQNAYHYVKQWDPALPRSIKWHQWPWKLTHPE